MSSRHASVPRVPVLECADCGNVLRITQAAFDEGSSAGRAVRTEKVTATDEELGQLILLLRIERVTSVENGRIISADRVLFSTDAGPIGIRADDGDIEIREIQRSDN